MKVCYAQGSPESYKDPKTGEWLGVFVELANELGTWMKVKVQPVEVQWNTAVLALKRGDCDFFGSSFVYNAPRAMEVNFIRPFRAKGLNAVIRKDNKKNLKSISDLNNENVKIAVGLGSREYETGKRLFPKAQFLALQIQADVETLAPTAARRRRRDDPADHQHQLVAADPGERGVGKDGFPGRGFRQRAGRLGGALRRPGMEGLPRHVFGLGRRQRPRRSATTTNTWRRRIRSPRSKHSALPIDFGERSSQPTPQGAGWLRLVGSRRTFAVVQPAVEHLLGISRRPADRHQVTVVLSILAMLLAVVIGTRRLPRDPGAQPLRSGACRPLCRVLPQHAGPGAARLGALRVAGDLRHQVRCVHQFADRARTAVERLSRRGIPGRYRVDRKGADRGGAVARHDLCAADAQDRPAAGVHPHAAGHPQPVRHLLQVHQHRLDHRGAGSHVPGRADRQRDFPADARLHRRGHHLFRARVRRVVRPFATCRASCRPAATSRRSAMPTA